MPPEPETPRRLGRHLAIGVRELGLPSEMASLIPAGMTPLAAATSVLEKSLLFDTDHYLAQEPADLDRDSPMLHYLSRGWRNGLAPNFYVDPRFYLGQSDIADAEAINPLFHYLYVGEPAGQCPSPHFEPKWYRERYRLIGLSALCHYLRHAHEHRLSPNPDFDIDDYLQAHDDLGEDRGDPFRHYVSCGRQEARSRRPGDRAPAPSGCELGGGRNIEAEVETVLASNLFDAIWYRGTSEAAADPIDLVRHYLIEGDPARRGPNPLFDVTFYASRHEDDIRGVDPFVHYVREGWRRGFDPHPLFDVSFYLDTYEDVREGGCEPLWHYLNFGWQEGRRPCAAFDTAFYLATNPDVRRQRVEPLTHYLWYGAAEGRNPSADFDTARYTRRVLRGEALNPLVHLRASGASVDDLVGAIALSKHYEMSNEDFECWTRWFRACDKPKASGADIVRIDAEDLGNAIAESRIARTEQGKTRRAYLACDASDAIDEDLLPHLAGSMALADLCVFDLAFERGGQWVPVLLPGANPVHLENVDASFSRFAISSRLLGQLDLDTGARPHDVLRAALAYLRATRRLDLFTHLAMPLLRIEDPSPVLRALRHELAFGAHVGSGSEPMMRQPASVSVVICTKDRCRLLSQILDALVALPSALIRDVVVVTNAAAESFAARVQAHYAGERRIEILRHDGPYNFSRQSNDGAARCSGDLLLFLNDDVVPIVPHWLEVLRAPFARAEVGITGPLLFYPDERTQHAGLFLGYHGCAGHALRGARVPDEDYMLMASAPRNVSAVTGAALLTRRALFEDLNGFDRQLGTYLQDVDYCLRVRDSGHEIVFEPRSFLFHMESVSMRESPDETVFGERRALEHRHFLRRWRDALFDDPFHNPSFELEDERLRTIVRSVF